jgi:TrmH family RNA methyltransferase
MEQGLPDRGPYPALITSRRNPLVRSMRELWKPAAMRRRGQLFLEGTHLLQESLRLALRPELVLATPSWIGLHAGLVSQLPDDTRMQPASEEVVAAATTTRHPDGVVHLLPLSCLPSPPQRRSGLVLALDRLQDPGNLGTVLRTALAAGVGVVWLGEGADPLQPKVMRSSCGAVLAMPVQRLEGAAFRQRLRLALEEGMQVLAAVTSDVGHDPQNAERALPYWAVDWRPPSVLLLGNEGAGVAADLLELASRRVMIPHSPMVESLNVAVAAAPLLLERWRQTHTPARG